MQHTDDRISTGATPFERARLDRLQNLVTQAGGLLPISGPISAFAFLNTIQALEDLPFDQGLCKGARLFGCNPYLTEDSYREKLARGRIRTSDLKAVVSQDLGDRANENVVTLDTRLEIRLAMLQFPLRMGPPEELQWFVAETDALKRLREEAPKATRERFVEETRRWVMRDVRDGSGKDSVVPRKREMLMQIIRRFGESSIERWSAATWEEFTLQVLWRVCRNGIQFADPPRVEMHPAIRHRDLLLDATGEDSDALVNELLIRFLRQFHRPGTSQLATSQSRTWLVEIVLRALSPGGRAPQSLAVRPFRGIGPDFGFQHGPGGASAGVANPIGRSREGMGRLHCGIATRAQRVGGNDLANGNPLRSRPASGAAGKPD